MDKQEKVDYLAVELMGWDWSGLEWNPLESADDCQTCLLKMGELGLGGKYARKLNSDYTFAGKSWEDGQFAQLTLPLPIQVDAMIAVLKARKDGE